MNRWRQTTWTLGVFLASGALVATALWSLVRATSYGDCDSSTWNYGNCYKDDRCAPADPSTCYATGFLCKNGKQCYYALYFQTKYYGACVSASTKNCLVCSPFWCAQAHMYTEIKGSACDGYQCEMVLGKNACNPPQ